MHVKIKPGRSYADTIKVVRSVDIDFTAIGGAVKTMRQTKARDLLV